MRIWLAVFGCCVLAGLVGCGGSGGLTAIPPAVSVNPSSVTLAPRATQTFTASVTTSINQAVNWSIQEGAAGGSITSAGLYTAPALPGTFHVVATSQADATFSG